MIRMEWSERGQVITVVNDEGIAVATLYLDVNDNLLPMSQVAVAAASPPREEMKRERKYDKECPKCKSEVRSFVDTNRGEAGFMCRDCGYPYWVRKGVN